MWFKTRVGFATVTSPMEIIVYKGANDRTWCIYARLKNLPEVKMKSFLRGQASVNNPTVVLAYFSDGPRGGKAISDCMAQIEDSIRTKAELCDLSESGDAPAWPKGWHQIQWQDGRPQK
jgi:hypothetical protein